MNIGLASVAVVTRDTQRNVAAMVAEMERHSALAWGFLLAI